MAPDTRAHYVRVGTVAGIASVIGTLLGVAVTALSLGERLASVETAVKDETANVAGELGAIRSDMRELRALVVSRK